MIRTVNVLKQGIALAAMVACSSLAAKPGDVVLSQESEQAHFQAVLVAEGLKFGWDMEFLPDGRLLVSEYDGRAWLIDTTNGQKTELEAVVETTDRGGLRGIAAHPDFSSNGLVYFCHANGFGDSNNTHISKAVLGEAGFSDVELVFEADNKAADLAHYGCRMLWLPDGTLLASFGDRRHNMTESQSLNDHYGTVIRINEDGSVPADNPFAATEGIRREIWAFGIRNTQGAVFHPQSGEIWATEHGARGGDEINVLKPGRNYGWPIATHGIDYDGSILSNTPLLPNVEPPRYYWYPSIAPSSLAFYTGDEFPKWQNDLFVTSLARTKVLRLEILDGHVIRTEDLLEDLGVRLRDVTMGSDGRLYVMTDSGDGRILRLEPVKTP